MDGLSRVPLKHKSLDVGQLLVQMLEPPLGFSVLGVSLINLVLVDDLTFDLLPSAGTLVLLPQLFLELSETLRYFVDGFVEVAVFVVLRVKVFFVTAALFARHNWLVLQRVL